MIYFKCRQIIRYVALLNKKVVTFRAWAGIRGLLYEDDRKFDTFSFPLLTVSSDSTLPLIKHT